VNGVAGGVEMDIGLQPVRQGSMAEVLGSTAERNENMVVVWIHCGTSPRQVGQDGYRLVFENKLPALGVVTGGGQRRIADEFLSECGASCVEQWSFTPRLCGDGLVALGVRFL